MIWKWMPPNGDFQDLPSSRELTVATALSLRRHHADTLIVPMTLIRDAYRAEILGGPEPDQAASGFGLRYVDAAVDAAARQPAGTLLLRSDRLSPAELADAVLARGGWSLPRSYVK